MVGPIQKKQLTFDAKSNLKQEKSKFSVSVSQTKEYERSLRKIAKAVGALVESHVDPDTGVIRDQIGLDRQLKAYAETLTPWAAKQASKMVGQASARNKKAWDAKSKLVGQLLTTEYSESEVGKTAAKLIADQTKYITSIPLDAAKRAQELSNKARMSGIRNKEVSKQILEEFGQTTKVTESRAILIARTETAKANAALNQARAQSVGAKKYIWRNAGDGAVREAHKTYKGKPLDGRVFSWDDPPTLDDGTTVNPGEIYNCRCYAEAVFD